MKFPRWRIFRPGRGGREAIARSGTIVVVLLVLFVAGGLLLALLFGIGEVMGHIASLGVTAFAGLCVLSLFSTLCRGLRWHIFTDRLDLAISLKANISIYIAGISMAATPGRSGDILRSWLMHRIWGSPYRRTIPLMIGDRLVEAIGVALLLLLGLGSFGGQVWLVLIICLIVAVVLLVVLRPEIAIFAIKVLYAFSGRRWARSFAFLVRCVRNTRPLFATYWFCPMFFLTLCAWLADVLGFYWLLILFDAPVPYLSALFVYSLAAFVGVASMLPGAIGGMEPLMIVMLAGLGVPASAAVAATIVIRVTTLWFCIALGFLFLGPLLRRASRKSPLAGNASR